MTDKYQPAPTLIRRNNGNVVKSNGKTVPNITFWEATTGDELRGVLVGCYRSSIYEHIQMRTNGHLDLRLHISEPLFIETDFAKFFNFTQSWSEYEYHILTAFSVEFTADDYNIMALAGEKT